MNLWLFAAYSSVFVLLLGYLLFLRSRLERLSAEIEELREELARIPRDTPETAPNPARRTRAPETT